MSTGTEPLRALSKRLGLYYLMRRASDQVKWSRRFERVRLATKPSDRHARQRELAMIGALVPPDSLCFDVGANIGDKTSLYLDNGCRVVALEPVARNVEILSR